MNCAISSFPVPLSPVMKTDASVGATLRASSMACRNAGELPRTTILSLWPWRFFWSSRAAFAARAAMTTCAARPTRTWRWAAENGFGRYSHAPSSSAWMLDWTLGLPVMMMATASGFAARAALSNSSPGT